MHASHVAGRARHAVARLADACRPHRGRRVAAEPSRGRHGRGPRARIWLARRGRNARCGLPRTLAHRLPLVLEPVVRVASASVSHQSFGELHTQDKGGDAPYLHTSCRHPQLLRELYAFFGGGERGAVVCFVEDPELLSVGALALLLHGFCLRFGGVGRRLDYGGDAGVWRGAVADARPHGGRPVYHRAAPLCEARGRVERRHRDGWGELTSIRSVGVEAVLLLLVLLRKGSVGRIAAAGRANLACCRHWDVGVHLRLRIKWG